MNGHLETFGIVFRFLTPIMSGMALLMLTSLVRSNEKIEASLEQHLRFEVPALRDRITVNEAVKKRLDSLERRANGHSRP